jgi:hypothetical protein
VRVHIIASEVDQAERYRALFEVNNALISNLGTARASSCMTRRRRCSGSRSSNPPAAAPLLPLGTEVSATDTPRRVGSRYATHAIGFQVSAAYLGAAAIPGAVGVAATWHGGDVIGLALVVVAVAVLALYEATTRIGGRAGVAALSQPS